MVDVIVFCLGRYSVQFSFVHTADYGIVGLWLLWLSWTVILVFTFYPTCRVVMDRRFEIFRSRSQFAFAHNISRLRSLYGLLLAVSVWPRPPVTPTTSGYRFVGDI